MKRKRLKNKKIDWIILFLPLALIIVLSFSFYIMPEQSNEILAKIRFTLGDTWGS